LLLAVLERRAGLTLGSQDVFLSLAGGLTISEPALDLAIIASVASSLKDLSLDYETVIFGELGLSGEIRAVPQAERRISEAQQLGFKRCILPQNNLNKIKSKSKMNLLGVNYITEVLQILW